MLKINGVELEFEIYDADMMDVYSAELERVEEDRQKTLETKHDKESDTIRELCDSVKLFFDNIFGAGTGEKVCGKNSNFVTCLNAFESVINDGIRQKEEIEKRADLKTGNRAQRRASVKK